LFAIAIALTGLMGLSGCSSITTENSAMPKFAVDHELFPFSPHYLELQNSARIHYRRS
jgi:uncharacterized protein YceK